MTATATRRGLLGAAAALPLIALPAALSATAAPTRIRPAFLRKLDRYHRMSAYHAAFEDGPLAHALRRLKAAEAKIPHTSVDVGESISGGRVVHSTDCKVSLSLARSAVAKPFSEPTYQAGLEEIAQAADARDLAIAHARHESGVAELCERSDRIGRVVFSAEWAFIQMRVASAAELETKLTFVMRHGDACDDATLEEILADVKVLAGSAAA